MSGLLRENPPVDTEEAVVITVKKLLKTSYTGHASVPTTQGPRHVGDISKLGLCSFERVKPNPNP